MPVDLRRPCRFSPECATSVCSPERSRLLIRLAPLLVVVVVVFAEMKTDPETKMALILASSKCTSYLPDKGGGMQLKNRELAGFAAYSVANSHALARAPHHRAHNRARTARECPFFRESSLKIINDRRTQGSQQRRLRRRRAKYNTVDYQKCPAHFPNEITSLAEEIQADCLFSKR